MSNCEVNHLPTLGVEQHQLKEILRCILHTIIFNRALGPVEPREVDSELFDVTYVQCGDSRVTHRVEEKINHLCAWAEKHPGRKSQTCLSFYEKRKRQNWLGIGGSQEERLFWEQWCINFEVLDPKISQAEQSSFSAPSVRSQRQAKLQSALEDLLLTVVRIVNEKKEHIPPVVSANTLTFPFDISVAGEYGSSFGFETVRRIIMQASPPPVLN